MTIVSEGYTMAGKRQENIDELPSGRYRVRYTDAQGQRKSVTFANKKEAISFKVAKAQEVSRDKDHIKLGIEVGKTFLDLARDYIEHKLAGAKNRQSATSVINRHLIPYFGTQEIPLDSLHLRLAGLVLGYKRVKQAAGLAINTVKNHLIILSSLLNYGYRVKKWLREPSSVEKPKEEALGENYLRSSEEIARFLRTAREVSTLAYHLYSFALFTGMRLGEIVALKWYNVDLERRQILVIESHRASTKNGESRRVPILDPLLPLLKGWQEIAASRGSDIAAGLVFPNGRGNQLDSDSKLFRGVFNKVLVRAGFPDNPIRKKSKRYITFHDLRHTFASHWVMNGGNLFKLQRILGHKSPEITQRYSHLAPEAFTDDLNRFTKIPDLGNQDGD